MIHIPVMLEESLRFLITDNNASYLDATFGRGGHSSAILDSLSETGCLTSFDKDPEAHDHATHTFQDNRFTFMPKGFEDLDQLENISIFQGFLFDLGVCSSHFDNSLRGFSLNKDGPLDMRFNPTKGLPLLEKLKLITEPELANIIYGFGDEKDSHRIARAIKKALNKSEDLTTLSLAKIIADSKRMKSSKTHPATKTFQALRIWINDEVACLEKAFNTIADLGKSGCRIVCISFHSLEDRTVKNFFRPQIKHYPKEIPLNSEITTAFNEIGKKIRPSQEEIEKNPRARSAIMRVFEKV